MLKQQNVPLVGLQSLEVLAFALADERGSFGRHGAVLTVSWSAGCLPYADNWLWVDGWCCGPVCTLGTFHCSSPAG